MEKKDLNKLDNMIFERRIIFSRRQTEVRFPKKVIKCLNIIKGNKFRFIVEFPDGSNKNPILKCEIVRNN